MRPHPAWLPTGDQQALLEACLAADDDAARAAFAAWRRQVDIERLDFGSYRLLPLLWKRMVALGLDHPSRNVIKGVYRRTWVGNHLVLARAADVVRLLAAEGIPAMLVKGAALTLRNYRDEGVRPMDDVDLAVPRGAARRAVDALVAGGWMPHATPLTGTRVSAAGAHAGWTAGPRPAAAFDEAYLGLRHAHGFQGPAGTDVDLHWFLFQGHGDAGGDERAWAAAQPAALQQAPVLLPDPADHLLLLLAHGVRWNPIPPLRWVADAVTLIRSEGTQLDWERFLAAARDRRLTLAAAGMLDYLQARFEVGAPERIRRELRTAPVTRRERQDFALTVSPPGIRAGLHELRWLYERYRALRRGPAGRDLPGFPAFVRHALGAPSLTQLGLYAVSELGRRVFGQRDRGGATRDRPPISSATAGTCSIRE